MQMKNSTDRYGLVAKLLHCLVALCVITMLLVGSLLDVLAGPTNEAVYDWHISLGMTLLALMIALMLWSTRSIKPSYPADMSFAQLTLAKVVRYLLYISVTSMCLCGWVFTTAKGHPPLLWGWFSLPAPFVPLSKSLGHMLKQCHTYLAWIIFSLVILHVIGALYHHFIRKDDVLKRML